MAQEGNPTRRLMALALAGVVAAAVIVLLVHHVRKPISLRGAVIKEDADSRKQSPITDVEITVADGFPTAATKSDFSGYFKLTLPLGIRRGRPITLRFRHADYQPLDLKDVVSDKLYIVRLVPIRQDLPAQPNHPETTVANVFVRYSIETTTTLNIGTGIKIFQIDNKGGVPCEHHAPCSPDGKWRAAVGSASLDAGEGNVYENARLSCIAGPCPFVKIVSDGFSRGGRNIAVSVLGWSDTTTFLLQAEVFREEISDIVRETYPVIFGQSINFTLPSAAEGPSLEAEINGTHIIFPLGPAPVLSWADCNVRAGKDQSKSYRCELKPGYGFR